MNFGDDRIELSVWNKISPEPNTACWLWMAALSSTGHPVVNRRGTKYVRHVIFEVARGVIEDSRLLTARCRVACCVNPHHCDVLTRRALNRERLGVTHCKHGHAMTTENTYYRSGGGRQCIRCNRDRKARAYAELSPEALARKKLDDFRNRLWSRFNLTVEEYEAMLSRQDHRCAICRIAFGELAVPQIDHCHETQTVRGVLCDACNNGIARFGDNAERCKRAADYLENPTNATEGPTP